MLRFVSYAFFALFGIGLLASAAQARDCPAGYYKDNGYCVPIRK